MQQEASKQKHPGSAHGKIPQGGTQPNHQALDDKVSKLIHLEVPLTVLLIALDTERISLLTVKEKKNVYVTAINI